MALLDSPIILFCSERSGSNLIAKIFDAHPNISAPGASHLFRVMHECGDRYEPNTDSLRAATLSLFRAKVSRWRIDNYSKQQLRAVLSTSSTAGEMAASLYAEEAKVNRKSHVLIKENSSFCYLTMIMAYSIQPRILFMTRDPRDMAVSWINGPVMRGGVLRSAKRWNADQTGYMRALTHFGKNTPIGFLRYEDLLANPESELRRVCGELNVEFSSAMMQFSEKSSSAQSDANRSSMWSNLNKPLLTSNSQKFKKELTDDQIAYVEAVNGPMMSALGYNSARVNLSAYGRFETLDALHAVLQEHEPNEKAAYKTLPIEERERFEKWSHLYAMMLAQRSLSPTALIGQ